MFDKGGKHSRCRAKRWYWLLIPLFALIYIVLGARGVVPWFDMDSCPSHIRKARVAQGSGDSTVATRHLIAAMHQVDQCPQYDRQCWTLMCEIIVGLTRIEETYPSVRDINAMARTWRPDQFAQAIRLRMKRHQLEQSIRMLKNTAEAKLEKEERQATDLAPFMQHAQLLIKAYQDTQQDTAAQSLLLRRHRALVLSLPPGDEQIIDSFDNIDYLDAMTPGEKMQLYVAEIARCEQAKPCPMVALMVLEDRSARFAGPSQQLAIASRCIGLMNSYLTDPASHLPPKFTRAFHAGSWLAIYGQQGQDSEAQRQIDRIITAARSTAADKRALAASILTDCARYCSVSGGGYTGGVVHHASDIRSLRKILAVQRWLAPESDSTALTWAMLGDIYLGRHEYPQAEQCYDQSIAVLNRIYGCDVTDMLCAHREPGNGKYNAVIWDIYGGYAKLLRQTGRIRIADQISPMLD